MTRVAENRTCGNCTLCCKIVSVLELEKPTMTWCEHCDIGRGCKIYDQKPESCRTFNCMWLLNTWMEESLRPDRCKVVFETCYGTKVILALLNEGNDDAHLKQPVAGLIEHIVGRLKYSVIVVKSGMAGREPIFYLQPGIDPVQVMDQLDWAADENLKRYALQEKISIEEAAAKRIAMVKTEQDRHG